MARWMDGWIEKNSGQMQSSFIYNAFKSILLLLEVQFSSQLRLMEIFVLIVSTALLPKQNLRRLGKKC